MVDPSLTKDYMFKINYRSKQRTDVSKDVTKITVLILSSSSFMLQCHQNNWGGDGEIKINSNEKRSKPKEHQPHVRTVTA